MGNINMPTPPLAQLWCYLFAFNFGCNENVNSLHPRELVIVYYVLQAKYHSSFGISSPDSLSHFFLIQLEVLFLFSIMARQREEKRLFWDYSLCRSQLSALLVYPIPYYSLFLNSLSKQFRICKYRQNSLRQASPIARIMNTGLCPKSRTTVHHYIIIGVLNIQAHFCLEHILEFLLNYIVFLQ